MADLNMATIGWYADVSTGTHYVNEVNKNAWPL